MVNVWFLNSVCEVDMLERLARSDSPRGVVLKHHLQQVESIVVDLLWAYQLSQVEGLVVWPAWHRYLWVLPDAWPGFLRW